MPPQSRRRQRGISLIESLIALVVAALGILGVVGVQMRTLTDTSSTVRRAQAIRLIEDLGERMKANPNALAVIDNYLSDFSHNPTPTNCPTMAAPTPNKPLTTWLSGSKASKCCRWVRPEFLRPRRKRD